ncbi:T9SS type A sorting domain-containing protein [Falsiporphyromonas endometrii]|uniref:T9SS type A sorting domain-containing protein n=1 Tax=Falsiporphyromonas endometrii TaxID=1387297 RepID=A0ABV9K6B5_9PORP
MNKLLTFLFLIVLSFTSGLFAQNSSSIWTGEASKWSNGNGTKENPYLIETPENLAYLSKIVLSEKKTFKGVYFKQTKDFDMNASTLPEDKKSFRPIGVFDAYQKTVNDKTQSFDESIPFDGVYDGDNHTISNLYVFYDNEDNPYASKEEKAKKILTIGGGGLFGFIGPNGSLLNLKLSENCTFVGGGSIASLASCSMGRIFNCHSAASVSAKDIFSAGIVSTILGGSIEHCSFTGNLIGTMTMGAICAYVDIPEGINVTGYETTPPVIINTFAHGQMICKGSFAGQAFGFVGSPFTMKNSYVSVSISGDSNGDPMFTGRFIGTFDKPIYKDKSEFDHVYVDKTVTVASAEALTSDGDKAIKGVVELSSQDMKTDDFVTKLGNAFVKDSSNKNDGFPILAENPKEPEGLAPITFDQFIITPMPVRDIANLNKEAEKIQIYSIEGRLLMTSSNTSSFDTSSLNDGIYVVLINRTQSIKISVQH